LHHLNISVESLDPALYERMREGARHRIFAANLQLMLECFARGTAPPRLRYNIMAYRSNLREIPRLVEILRQQKRAWQVEIRHTFDVAHIPAEFRESEFLTSAEWAWLADALAQYPKDEVLVLLSPGGKGYDPVSGDASPSTIAIEASEARAGGQTRVPDPRYDRIPRPLNIAMEWDGSLRVYGEEVRAPGEPPVHANYVMTNINYLRDPLRFLLAL
jgi:hypothetical protein